MGRVPSTVKRFFSILSSIFLIQLYFSTSIFSSPSPYTYDILLKQAITKMNAYDYGHALDRLEIARRKNPSPDYRYYYILGETYFRMGKMTESMSAFQESLNREPGQVELLEKMAKFHESDRRPHFALRYLKKYLRFLPDDKEKTYRAAILAKLSGENQYADQLFTKLESDRTYRIEKSAIIEKIQHHIQNGDWNPAIESSEKFLLYFPREEILHEFLILALRGSKSKNVEKAIIDSTAIFSDNANFAVRYGIFLQEQERMLEALSAFRRAFSISLIQDQNLSNQAEIFFLIRQTYSFLNREHDARALANLANLIQKGKADESDSVIQATKTYPKNRETLEFAIHFFAKTNDKSNEQYFRKELKARDVEHEISELIFVIGPFSRENLE